MQEDSYNSTVILNGVSYNATALKHWNYTFYDNRTLSNGSECYLVFDQFIPILISPNGTFANTTSCYTPIYSIGARGITGLVFGSLFAFSIVVSTINLRKHGRAYLPRERRWKPVGRRWPWYWTIFVAACGLLSSFTSVDVDRDYIVNMPMILQSFFLTLVIPIMLACVWEAVRSWTSFKHREIHDVDPFAFRITDSHAKLDFYLPLLFYAFDWAVFFLIIPRGWSFAQKQRSETQTLLSARPAALDARFKAGAVLAIICLALTVFRLAFSSRIYRVNIPWTLLQVTVLVAIRLAYMLAGSWIWQISPYRLDVSIGWLYGLGYTPIILILALLNLRGYLGENEDKILIAQRALRGDGDGIQLAPRRQQPIPSHVQRDPPSWWARSRDSMPFANRGFKVPTSPTMGDSSAPGTSSNLPGDQDESGHSWWQRRKQDEYDTRYRKSKPGKIAPSSAPPAIETNEGSGRVEKRWTERGDSSASFVGSQSSKTPNGRGVYDSPKGGGGDHTVSTVSLQARPQVVRSMLDV